MYKIMLVDDEYFAREAMKASVNWSDYKCAVCLEAKNGQEGLKKAREFKPDIIISDINMPVMGGLDMISILQPELPDTVFVIVTGYGEFEYAKRAIELGLHYFIMKPVETDKMLATVSEIVSQLDEREQRKLEYRSLRYWATVNNTESQIKFIDLLLFEKEGIPKTRFQFECEQLNLPLASGGYGICYFKIDSRTIVRFSREEWRILVAELMGEENSKWKYLVHYNGAGNLYLIFYALQPDQWNEAVLSAMMQKVQLGFLQKWVCTVLMGTGNYCESYEEIPVSCKAAESSAREVRVSKLVSDALQYVHRNYKDNDLSVKSIADALFVNYSYLSAQFAKEIEMSASHYIARFRMAKAVDAIRSGKENMVEIALSVGYTDIKYFYRVFKREFGMTPNQCAEKILESIKQGEKL